MQAPTNYTVIGSRNFCEYGFSATDEDSACARAENIAAEWGQHVTLYESLPNRKLRKITAILPDRGF